MRILVISNTPWRDDNSFGNSYTSIFKGIKKIELANIYCNYGAPDNDLVAHHFQITEKSLIHNLLNPKYPSGRVVENNKETAPLTNSQAKGVNFFKKNRLQIFFWIRDLIWIIGRWKSPQINKFITDFQPDIIFQPLYYSNYINNIVVYIKKLTNAPMVAYVSDDVYTLRQFSLSPLFWIDRFIKRRKIRKVVNLCEHLYVISDIQKKDYEKCFGIECRVLTKGAEFITPQLKSENNTPLKFVFTGNIGAGRWKSLAMIADALNDINKDHIKVQLIIYTPSPLTKRMQKALTKNESVRLTGAVPSSEISAIHSDADVLIHVESLDLKERLLVRQSFSTKIVDYLHAARTIFAIGSPEVASMDFLTKNDAAIVAFNKESVREQIKYIVNDKSVLNEYAIKAWECGKRNNQISEIQKRLSTDLTELKNKKDESTTN